VVVGTGRAADCRLRNNAGGSSHTKAETNHDKLANLGEANRVVRGSVLAVRTKRGGEFRHGGITCVWVCLTKGENQPCQEKTLSNVFDLVMAEYPD
jgi:hypothetical protein